MKLLVNILVFVVVTTLIGIDGRHVDGDYEELPEVEEQTELLNRLKDHATQMRHRRRSRQMYGYPDYPTYFHDSRRDYSIRIQEEYLTRILSSLDEIVSNMKRNPPPPPEIKPLYIPYPVYQPRPCVSRPASKPKPSNNDSDALGFPDRFPVMEDPNQNWGLGFEQEMPEEEGDGSRPISFDPVPPSRPVSKKPPPVEHGTSQDGMEQTTRAPTRPGLCETAILNCCSLAPSQQRNCFTRYGCTRLYSTKRACEPDVIKRVLDQFSQAYALVQN